MTGPEETPPAERPSFQRPVVIGAAVVAVLLVGAVVGMFLTQLATRTESSSAVPAAGSVEVGFAQDMSVHHLQAVTMASWERDHTSDPQLKQLAFDIESTQREQVGRMKGWLMLWGQPEQATGEYMTWMTSDAGHEHMAMAPSAAVAGGSDGAVMPGMATNTELAKLRSLSGQELDVFFLQLMLRHHQGGTDMAQYAHDHSPNSAVKALTQSILTSQGAEMTLMRDMLTARGGTPLPFP
jgi:uncharacterized protein (DUF305 family)